MSFDKENKGISKKEISELDSTAFQNFLKKKDVFCLTNEFFKSIKEILEKDQEKRLIFSVVVAKKLTHVLANSMDRPIKKIMEELPKELKGEKYQILKITKASLQIMEERIKEVRDYLKQE